MWTPEREDLLLELCGEIDDEDTTLVDRAEERSERSSEYSDKRADDAARAHNAVEAITEHIPLGQPILSATTPNAAHARTPSASRPARQVQGTPRRRSRRIKGLEADKREQERYLAEATTTLRAWAPCEAIEYAGVQKAAALKLASNSASFRPVSKMAPSV